MRRLITVGLSLIMLLITAAYVMAQETEVHLPIILSVSGADNMVAEATPIVVIVVTPTPLSPTKTPTPYPTIAPKWTPVPDEYNPGEIVITDVNKDTNEITIRNRSIRDIWIRGWILEDAPKTWKCKIWDTTYLVINEERTYHIDTLCGLTEDLLTDDNEQDYVLLTSRYVVIDFVRK